jgi:hypothetical protein
MVIPLLCLPLPTRAKIRKAIRQRAKFSDSELAVRAVIEEFGDDFEGIKQVIDHLETRGDLAPGLWQILTKHMEGVPPSEDWRRAYRSVEGHH